MMWAACSSRSFGTRVISATRAGEYRLTVEKVWGRPLGNKVQLRIIRYQGTDEETERLVTLKMVSNISEPIIVKLDNGRRTETAYVPPPSAQQQLDAAVPADDHDAVLTRLRGLADPEATRMEVARQHGGVVVFNMAHH